MATMLFSLALLSLAAASPIALPPAPICSKLQLVLARGTTEPLSPSYGIVVGDPLFFAVQALIPDVTGYSVNYPASFEPDSKTKGAADVLKHVAKQANDCPRQKFALVGYSQGADLMHSAVKQFDSELYDRVVALVMFGDPGNKGPEAKTLLGGGKVPVFPAALAQKTMQVCATGDPVCTNSGVKLEAHLEYVDEAYMKPAAEYIALQFKEDGKAGPRPSPNGGAKDKGDNTDALKKLGEMLGASKDELSHFG